MRVVVLTGAGVSAESGLGTFRDPGGVWKTVDPMKLATPQGFAADPGAVHEFYNRRRAALVDAAPNAAHQALARLERAFEAAGADLLLVTQNIDDLHERAGSREPVHMHGELLKVRCGNCGEVWRHRDDIYIETVCHHCSAVGRVRPHVVWFGETPFAMDRIEVALMNADLFVAVGTSGSVYPAAGFVAQAMIAGARTMELNLEPSDNAHLFDEGRYGPATEIVPAWVDEISDAV